jgi:uncharacterized protein YndB with AHSA1/START domain
MAEIKLNLVIKATPEKIYEAITTQEGLANWWAKRTVAKPDVGFVNQFTFGNYQKEIEVTKLIPNKTVEWKCISAIEEWIGTDISFDIEKKDERTILRFTHAGWKAITDTYGVCTYDWAMFMKSLKSYSETGTGTPC